VLEALFTSARNEDHIEMLVKWFDSGFVHDSNGQKLEIEISKKHKHSIMERIWSSEKMSLQFKEEMMAKLAKIDKSDWLDNTQKVCEAAHPENKEKMWKEYFNLGEDSQCADWGLLHF